MSSDLRKSIFKTLVYADIFDYPLTIEELWRYLISDKEIDKAEILKEIKQIKNIVKIGDFYCFDKRKEIVKERIIREKESQNKFTIAQKAAKFISLIPTVFLISISGTVAMKNAKKVDDIDFFIIAKKNTLWTTRLLIILMLKILRLHRQIDSQDVADKICLNMFISEEALRLPQYRQDVYTAHEIAQMIPLFERNNVYRKFIKENIWVDKFLPHALKCKTTLRSKQKHAESFISVYLSDILRLSVLEFAARRVQMRNIKKHLTTETISNHLLAFHPKDNRKKILYAFSKKINKYL